MKKTLTLNLVLSAMFIALGIVLPFLTGQIPSIGSMLLPMHIPVLLCGLICGWQYGLVVGAVLPVLRSAIFGMPPMFPTAVAMSFELAAYGLVAGLMFGLIFGKLRKQNIATLYVSLIVAMIVGRAVWGAAMIVLMGLNGGAFTWKAFAAGAFLKAYPGIIIQLVLIPPLVMALNAAHLIKFRSGKEPAQNG